MSRVDSMSVYSPNLRQRRESSMMASGADSSPMPLPTLRLDFSFAGPDSACDSPGLITPPPRSTSISGVSEGSLEEQREDSESRRDSDVLYDSNQNLKSSLTNLLNSQAVRANDQMRAWVQIRLMEAERERKMERRKRLSIVNIPPSPSETFVGMETLLSTAKKQAH